MQDSVLQTSHLIALLFFVVPGFIAVEVSNGLSPRRSLQRSDQEKLSGMLIFGSAIYTLFAWYLGVSFNGALAALTDTPSVTVWYVAAMFLAALVLGGLWGVARGTLIREAYYRWAAWSRSRGRNGYLGALSVWDLLLEKHVAGRYLQVRTEDDLIFVGSFFLGSDIAGEQELVLENVKWADAGKGSELRWIEHNPLVYIPMSKVRYVTVYRPDPHPLGPKDDEPKRCPYSPDDPSPEDPAPAPADGDGGAPDVGEIEISGGKDEAPPPCTPLLVPPGATAEA